MTKRDIDRYQRAYLADYGFEKKMVFYRRRMLLDRIRHVQPEYVLEVGCGEESLYNHCLANGLTVKSWGIVEPARRFCEAAAAHRLPKCQIVHGFIEDEVNELKNILPAIPDLVICSSVLHEVSSAHRFLAAVSNVMGINSLLHVNVPNARSFHRRLAVAMGIIQDETEMSDRNRILQQHRVYDLKALTCDLENADFCVVQTGGYFVKPFTHVQMESILPVLGDAVMDGLFELGIRNPEWASEIFAECRKNRE
jgi:SAM-dependent methyltransferase